MRSEFSFPYVDIQFEGPNNEFILKKKQFAMLVLFPPIFVADTKILYGYNAVAQ